MQYCDKCANIIAGVINSAPSRDEKLRLKPMKPNALVSYIKRLGDCEYCGGPGPCNGTHSSKVLTMNWPAKGRMS
jgi:hypothetical protein